MKTFLLYWLCTLNALSWKQNYSRLRSPSQTLPRDISWYEWKLKAMMLNNDAITHKHTHTHARVPHAHIVIVMDGRQTQRHTLHRFLPVLLAPSPSHSPSSRRWSRTSPHLLRSHSSTFGAGGCVAAGGCAGGGALGGCSGVLPAGSFGGCVAAGGRAGGGALGGCSGVLLAGSFSGWSAGGLGGCAAGGLGGFTPAGGGGGGGGACSDGGVGGCAGGGGGGAAGAGLNTDTKECHRGHNGKRL